MMIDTLIKNSFAQMVLFVENEEVTEDEQIDAVLQMAVKVMRIRDAHAAGFATDRLVGEALWVSRRLEAFVRGLEWDADTRDSAVTAIRVITR